MSGILVGIWFRGRVPFGSGEVGIPFVGIGETARWSRWVWSDGQLGGIFPTTFAGTAFWGVSWVVSALGAPAWLNVALFVWGMMVIGAWSVLALVRTTGIPDKERVGVAAGLLYATGPVAMVNVWNRFLVTHMLAFAFFPLALLLMRRAYRRKRMLPYIGIFCVLNVYFAAMYPTAGFVLVLWGALALDAALHVLWGMGVGRARVIKAFVIAAVFWLVTDAWWLLPFQNLGAQILSQAAGASTNVSALLGQSRFLGLRDVIRGINQAAVIENAGFGEVYRAGWMQFLGYAGALAAVIGLLKRRMDREILFWGTIFVASLFVMKGANPPGGGILTTLLSRSAYLGVFRNPYERLSIVFAIATSILAAIALLSGRIRLRTVVPRVLLLAAMLAYTWPIYTGRVMATSQFGSYEVRIPKGYEQATRWLAEHPDPTGVRARALLLPQSLDGISLMWEAGYRGVDIGPLLIPGSVAVDAPIPVRPDIRGDILHLPLGPDPVRAMEALAVRYVIVRSDVNQYSDGLVDPVLARSKLDADPAFVFRKEFPPLRIYELVSSCVRPLVIGTVEVRRARVPTLSELPRMRGGCPVALEDAPVETTSALAPTPPVLGVRRVNPTMYRVEVSAPGPFWLVTGDAFDPRWRAFVSRPGAYRCPLEWSELCIEREEKAAGGPLPVHRMAESYANAWYVPDAGRYQVTIHFGPQRLMDLGLAISALGFLSLLLLAPAAWMLRRVARRLWRNRVPAWAGPGPALWRIPAVLLREAKRVVMFVATTLVGRRTLGGWFGAFLFDLGLRERRVLARLGQPVTERSVEYPWVLENLPPPPQKILIVGCVLSYLPHKFIALGYDVHGVDAADFPQAHPKLRFLRSDSRSLPYRDDSFDLVTCVSTIEHIGLGAFGDPLGDAADAATVDEMLRVLKPEGVLLLTTPFGGTFRETPTHRIYTADAIAALFGRFDTQRRVYFVKTPGGWVEASEDQAAEASDGDAVAAVIALVLRKPARAMSAPSRPEASWLPWGPFPAHGE